MEYSPIEAVHLAMNNKVVDFSDMVNNGLSAKILDAIEAKRVEVASKIFGTPEYDAANAEVPTEVEDTTETDNVETPTTEEE